MYYPIFVDVRNKPVLVVGAGRVAARKAAVLLSYGAKIDIVGKLLCEEMNAMVESGRLCYLGPLFREEQVSGRFMVVAATDDRDLNEQVSLAAQARGILVNAADQPAACNFILPSVVRRGALQIAISTSGKSPALARALRIRLEGEFGPEYGLLVELMGRVREAVLALGKPPEDNQAVFRRLVGSGLLEALRERNQAAVREVLSRCLPQGVAAEELLEGLGEGEGWHQSCSTWRSCSSWWQAAGSWSTSSGSGRRCSRSLTGSCWPGLHATPPSWPCSTSPWGWHRS